MVSLWLALKWLRESLSPRPIIVRPQWRLQPEEA